MNAGAVSLHRCGVDGWIIDSSRHTAGVYQECSSQIGDIVKLKVRKELYAIHEPFKMDSQYKSPDLSPDHKPIPSRKRKRRHTGQLNEGRTKAAEYHEKVRESIMRSYERIVKQGRSLGLFLDQAQSSNNNRVAREVASFVLQGPNIETSADSHQLAGPQGRCRMKPGASPLLQSIQFRLPDTSGVCRISPVFNTFYEYGGDAPQLVTCQGTEYVLPPRSRFLISDVTQFGLLIDEGTKYDLIVLDPPWFNKSVKRKKTYSTLNEDELALPLPALMADGCLVVVWVTNKQRQHDCVRNVLFPKWSVKVVAEWHWLKVTQHGDPVYNIDSPHKKPYENLLIGRHISPKKVQRVLPPEGLAPSAVIVSVPSAIHSHKPSLSDLLGPYLPKNPNCLEMFARNLTPNWTSWGNEVLKFQSMHYFEGAESAKTER